MWDGNTLLHEWEEESVNKLKPKSKIDYKADFVVKLDKAEEERRREEAEEGERVPDSLVTWIFQDDFIPRGKITKEGVYSIVSDYLGTPVEAYDGGGNKVRERELDIYGRVKTGRKDDYGRTEKEIGEKGFIPFRFQGQYDDEETGLYYNRFRYYSPDDGCYTQQDPIGLAGGNPTIYAYVSDSVDEIDPLGLSWSDVLRKLNVQQPSGLTKPHGHHIVFKGNFNNKIAIPVSASKKILERFKIDINDPANLMWASNIEGVHTEVNAQKVLARLEKMEKKLNLKLKQNKLTFKQVQLKMKKEDEKYIRKNKSRFSEEIVNKMREGSINLSKWIPAEWGYSDGKRSELSKISKLLYKKEESLNQEEYLRYKEMFLETVTSAFKYLIETKVFGESSEEITFFISMSDDENISEIENYSAKLLNSKNLYEEFLRRNEFWENLFNES